MSPEITLFLAACFLPTYLIGSIPFGYIIGRLNGVDIRKQGSGNIGATNVWRVLGKKWGILTFTLDFSKILAVAPFLYPYPLLTHFCPPNAPALISDLGGIFILLGGVIGHNYPVWLGFKGGKGIATSAGGLLWLMPASFLVVLGVWIIAFVFSRIVSLSSIVAAFVLPLANFYFYGPGILTWFCILLAALAVLRHRANIERLRKGTEPRWTKKPSPESAP